MSAFTPEQEALIKRTICKPKRREATTDELALFIGQAKRTGLDPFSRQIYAVFRYDKRLGGEVMTVQTAIDGFRSIAERTGRYAGKTATYWCGKSGRWKETWLAADGHPHAAKVTVAKIIEGNAYETSAVAHWREYVVPESPFWRDMPANQNAKVAEALALRQAFPNDLSGLYTDDEMGQADRRSVQDGPQNVSEVAGVQVVEDARVPPGLIAVVGQLDLEQLLQVASIVEELDEHTVTMLCIAAGVEHPGQLGPATLPSFMQAYEAHRAGVGAA